MKVLHVVSGILGGAGRVVHELAKALAPDAHSEVVLFSTAKPDPVMVSTLRGSCEQVYEVTKLGKIDPLAVARMALVLRRARPDVILLHDFTAYVWASLAARLVGRVPLIAVEHSNCLGSPLRRRVRRTLHPIFAATICVSPRLEEGLRAIGVTTRVHTVRNGIDQAGLTPLGARPRFDAPALRLLMVGRLDLPKDHRTLFRALRQLGDRRLPVELLVIGDGSLAPELAREVRALGLDSIVRFEGAQTDLVPYLATTDVVVLSSRAEGLPLALIEAMAAGCLAIASSVGAIGELLDDGKAGVLVPPGDAAALAAAISAVSLHPEDARALAEAGTRRVHELYSARHMASGYRELFDRYLENSTTAAATRSRA